MAVHGQNSFKLQALNEKHRQVASLMAQGLGPLEIASVVDYTMQYISMLARDPLFKEHLSNISQFVTLQHEAMFARTVEAVNNGFNSGIVEDNLKAARLNLEITGRIGKGERPSAGMESSLDRLATLAERLLALNPNKGETLDAEFTQANQPALIEGQTA